MPQYFAADGAPLQTQGNPTYPSAFYDSGTDTSWFARDVISPDGAHGIRIISYDHTAEAWGADRVIATHALLNDSHGTPAIVRDDEGYLHAFFGGHNTDVLHYASNAADDPTAWTLRNTFSGSYTYPHPVLIGDALYLFMRKAVAASTKMIGVVFKTTALAAGVPTWGSEGAFVDLGADTRFYMGDVLVSSTDIHIIATRANYADTARRDVYHFVYKTATGAVANSDATHSEAAGSLPISLTTANSYYRVVSHGSNFGDLPSACFDSTGDLHIIYPNGSVQTTCALKHIAFDGSSWSSPADVGVNLYGTAGVGKVEHTATVPLVAGEIAVFYPEDDDGDFGSGGNMARIIRNASGTWGLSANLLSAGTRAISRPSAVRGAHADARVIFHEIAQTEGDDEGTDFRIYAHGDSGFLIKPDPSQELTQDAVGLLHANNAFAAPYQLIPFDTADWTASSGNSLSLTGDLRLRVSRSGSGSDSRGCARLDTIGSRASTLIFARIQRISGRFGVMGHITDLTAGSEDFLGISIPGGSSLTAGLFDWTNGSSTALDSLASQNAPANAFDFSMFLNGTTIVGWDEHTDRDWAGTASAHNTGQLGVLRSGGSVGEMLDVNQFFAQAGRYVTITNLATGDTVELREWDHTVLVTASESSGTALLDMHKVSPAHVYEIAVIRSSADLTVYRRPDGDFVAGGDEFSLSGSPPTISAVIDSAIQVTVTVETPGFGSTDHELYVSPTLATLWDAASLYADSLGATPTPIIVVPLTPEVTYYVGVLAIGGTGAGQSNVVTVDMPELLDPTLILSGNTDISGTLRLINVDPLDADEVNYQTTTAADTTYATPVDDATITDASRFTHQVTGLTQATAYRSRARYRVGAGNWSTWLEITWSTLATPPPADVLSHWLKPAFGELVTGTYCAQMAIEIPFFITDIEISDDDGATWSPLTGETEFAPADSRLEYWEICFDSTTYTDGFYLLRFTLDDAVVVVHHGFHIANDATDAVGGFATDVNDFNRYWLPTEPLFRSREYVTSAGLSCRANSFPSGGSTVLSFSPIVYDVGHIGPTTQYGDTGASFGPFDPPWLAQNRGVDVSALFYSMVNGGGQAWEIMQGGEYVTVGIAVAADPADINSGIRFFWESGANMSPVWEGAPDTCTGGSWSWSRMGRGEGRVVLIIGGQRFTAPIRTHVGWLGLKQYKSCLDEDPAIFCTHWFHGNYRGIPLRLRAWRPDPTGFPNRWSVYARAVGPPLIGNARGNIVTSQSVMDPQVIEFEETVDLASELGCGPIHFFTARPPGPQSDTSGRFLHSWSAQPIGDADWGCSETTAITEDGDLWRITFFEDDGVTPLWGTYDVATDTIIEGSFHTSRRFPRTYMKDPINRSNAEVVFHEGRVITGGMTVEVVDVPSDPTDQTTGIITSRLNEIQDCRTIVDWWDYWNRRWVRAADGVTYSIRNDASRIVTYSFTVRDVGENERRMALFDRNETWSLYPEGPVEPWGDLSTDDYFGGTIPAALIPAVTPLMGTFEQDTSAGGRRSGTVTISGLDDYTNDLSSIARLMGEPGAVDSTTTIFGTFETIGYPGITVRWRPAAGGAWTYLRNMYAQFNPANNYWLAYLGFQIFPTNSPPKVYLEGLDADMPADSASIDVQVLAVWTTPETPFLWTGRFNEMFIKAYDGDWTLRPTRVTYVAADFTAWSTPIARIWRTEPVENGKEWLEKNGYAVLSSAAARDWRGRIYPIFYTKPPIDPSTLAVLDATNVKRNAEASWESNDNIVRQVDYEYPRDYLLQQSSSFLVGIIKKILRISTDAYVTQRQVKLQFGVSDGRGRKMSFKPETLRAVGVIDTGEPLFNNIQTEPAWIVAKASAEALMDRWKEETFTITLDADGQHDQAVNDLVPGQWVVVTLSWLADPTTGLRGCDRICQVIEVGPPDMARFHPVTLLDGGANLTPISGSATVTAYANADDYLEVDVSAITAGMGVRVQWALEYPDGTPITESMWNNWFRTDVATVQTLPFQVFWDMWVRWRLEAPGKFPGAWTEIQVEGSASADPPGYPPVGLGRYGRSVTGGGGDVVSTYTVP